MKEITSKEQLLHQAENDEKIVIVQHKRVARVLTRYLQREEYGEKIQEILTLLPLMQKKKILGVSCMDRSMMQVIEDAVYYVVKLPKDLHKEAVEILREFGVEQICLIDYEVFAAISKEENPQLDFLCCGFTKCGTTSLSNALRKHPQIVLPKGKETFYLHWRNKYDDSPEIFRKKYMSERQEGKLYGDIEPSYHLSARDVYECFGPDVKLLFLVRQPSKATYSYFKMLMRRPRKKKYVDYYRQYKKYSVDLFSRFVEEEIYTEMKDRYRYDKWIREYLEFFPAEQIKVVVMEELIDNPTEVLQEIQEFIGVTQFKHYEKLPYSNEGSGVSRGWISAYINYRYYASIRGKKEHLERSRKQKLFFRFAKWAQKYTVLENEEKMTEEQKRELDDFYRPSVERLEALLGRSLKKTWEM